jgi:hypothetical protein
MNTNSLESNEDQDKKKKLMEENAVLKKKLQDEHLNLTE